MRNEEAAKKYYMKGLVSSNYMDNNTVASPIINWYLGNGQKEEAFKICEEILLHNPENKVAKYYRERLKGKSRV
ncbi:MAG: hypothetical protein KKG21_02945 [Candidatus Omnitrophica bacterium]|nr:hypothetical protein [Candidatus Omnitrophota bacterium]